MEQEVGTWDSVLLENLSEDSFINNIHQRYKCDRIYTYIGTSVVAVNPYHHISEHSLDIMSNYSSRGIFQLPPHIYGLINLAYESLIDQKQDQCILLTGESGSGKTESFKMIVNFLTQIQDKSRMARKNACNSMKMNGNGMIPRRSSSCAANPTNIIIADPQRKYRRNSNSYAIGSNVCNILRHCKSNTTLNDNAANRQSLSPAATVKQRCDMAITSHHLNGRAESTERYYSARHARDKVVDFDFSHHKSTENLSANDRVGAGNSTATGTVTTAFVDTYNSSRFLASPLVDHPAKSCFKQQQQLHPSYYHHQTTQTCCITTTVDKSFLTNTTTTAKGALSTQQLNANTSPKFISCSSCQAEWRHHHHSSQRRRSLSTTSAELRSGSYTNLLRQHSTESYIKPSERLPRISLYDAYKMNQKFIKHNSQDQHATSCTSTPSLISSHIQRNPAKHLRECVSYADVFLEAMGNAVTLQNTNASRYGKLFDIEMDFKGDPIGVHITHYMLEKTRITDCSSRTGDRNFHIFYQLLLGGDLHLLKSLKLYRNIEKYALLKNTTALEEDRINFHYTKKSLDALNLSCDDINGIFHVLAAVLKFGNMIFVPITNIDGTEGCQISNNYEVQETGNLLNMEAQILMNCLTRAYCSYNNNNNNNNNSNYMEDEVGYELDARQASNIRDILCRTLYGRLFTWLVNKINELLKSSQREHKLAILDFYGFEVLEHNSFEQFTINYSAEKIHQHFIKHILRFEQELYINEGLEWTRIDYYDNESICELIEKPNYGILSLMNESHLTTDEALLQRIRQCCAGHTNFIMYGPNARTFRIRHFANAVNYSICGFLEKNVDTLSKYISSAFYQSKLPIIKHLFPEGNPRRQAIKKPSTISSNMRNQLQSLLATIQQRSTHYVFCIKPNECRQSQLFDMALVQHQVRYMSLIPLIHLCRAGHCYHMAHGKFFARYKLLNSVTWPHYTGGNIVEGVAIIIRSLPLPAAEFTIGIKNVFIRSPRTVYELEQFRKGRIIELAILIQKLYRMYRARKEFMLKRHSQLIISSAWRIWKECRFGIPRNRRQHLWNLYRIAREEYRSVKYKRQIKWAVDVISHHYRQWKIREFLLTIPLKLPPNTMSPLSIDWPTAPTFLTESSRLLHSIYHRWKCYVYRNMFDQTTRNRMREKVTASIIFKDRKASYPFSVSHPFVGDYLRLRHNQLWRDMCAETNDQYVVFADIINKITRSSGKISPVLLVISTSSLLLLDQRTLQIKYRVPATEIYRMSLSPYLDNIAVFHIRASEFGRKKGDFVFHTCHVIEIVTKMFLVVQNATGKPPEIHISTEFEANFNQQTVIFNFKYGGGSSSGTGGSGSGISSGLNKGPPKVIRKANRMEIIV